MPSPEDVGLLNALSSTITAMENLLTLTEHVCGRLQEHAPADDPELRHVQHQLVAARERLPVVKAYVDGLRGKVMVQ
jgi:hypothetical protein